MRIPPLLADFIYNRGCELKCEKFLTRPVHGYRECNIPVQVKGGSLAQLSGVSPLSTGYYLTQKAARNQLRCPSPLSGKSKRKGGTHVKLTRHNGRAGKNGVYNPKHNDRSFDIANSEHIDEERAKQNLYWDCYNGLGQFTRNYTQTTKRGLLTTNKG